MGLFSSKKIYNAYAGSSSLFEEDPATLKTGILQQAMANEGTMSSAIQFVIATDVAARAKAMFRYAAKYDDPAKTGGYIRGFPTSNMNLVVVDPAAVEAALTRAVGTYDNIRYTLKGAYNSEFFLQEAVQDLYTDTNYFGWSSGLPTNTHWDEYRTDVEIPIVNPDTGAYYIASAPFDYSRYTPWAPEPGDEDFTFQPPEESGTEFTVTFPYVDNLGADQTYTLEKRIDVGETVFNYNWIMIAYDVGENTYYWKYQIGSGADPVFESAIGVSQKEGEFLPVAVLMQDKVWFDENPDSELAITTNKLMKKMATSATKIREDFQETEDDPENKDQVGEKWDFFIHFAIPIREQGRGPLEYFWRFFTELDQWSTFDTNEYYEYLSRPASAQPINELTITEAGINGYNVAYRWSYIHQKEFPGEFTYDIKVYDQLPVIDPDNPANNVPEISHIETRTLGPKKLTSALYQREEVVSAEYQENLDDMFGPGTPVGLWNDPEKDKDDDNGYHDYYIITLQNPELKDQPGVPQGYTRMLVMGLSMEYTINTREDPNKKGDYRYRYASPQLFGEEQVTKEFRIPILWKALKDMPTLHREQACAAGLCATVFLVDKVKVPWYQKTFFKWLIVVIAIVLLVLSVYYAGGAGSETLLSVIAGALGATGAMAVVVYVVLVFAMGIIFSLASATISEEFGSTAGLIFNLIVMAVMFYSAGGFEGISKSWNSMISSPGWMSAVNLINAVTPVYNMGFAVYQNRVMAGLEDEMRDFLVSAQEKNEMLADAWAGMGDTPDWLDPMDLVNMFRRVGSAESASGYLARTINPNPGIMGIQAITKFPEIAISLPRDLQEGTVVDSMMLEFAKQRGAV